jgi:hypothetical protein
VLGQRAEVGVGTRVEVAGPLGDPLRNVIVVPGPPEIVNEVGHRFAQSDATHDPIRCVSKGHRMPSPRRQDVAQLGAIAILTLRKDPLRRGAHATKSAVTDNQHGPAGHNTIDTPRSSVVQVQLPWYSATASKVSVTKSSLAVLLPSEEISLTSGDACVELAFGVGGIGI